MDIADIEARTKGFDLGEYQLPKAEYNSASDTWSVSYIPRDADSTAKKLNEEGLPVTVINKVQEGRPDIVDKMRSGGVQLVFNTTEGAQAIADSFSLRRTALTHNIPYYTTVAGARAAVQAIAALRRGCLEVAPLQSYL